MNLILIRHGETDWNRIGRCQGVADIVLNENGKKQARELAHSLRDHNIKAIYSSDLKRAHETAQHIAEHHNITVQLEPGLQEMNQGDLEGLSFPDIRDKYAEVLKQWRESPETLRLPSGESLVEVQNRAWKVFEKVHQNHIGETVVVVSHNLTIITLLCKITGVGLKGFRDFHIEATSKNIIISEDGSLRIDVINDVSHLSPMESVPLFESN
ncbi:MAG: histidine phosphatase family protein [Thermodesulfobacteriales bacterium]|jgi:broad specificity phosphatase PhoE|nr:MAG: histidine phosphatase family protein [Thermodesulfobacteriales bacterium]